MNIGFYEIDVGLGPSTDFEGMRIAAMQDMNNDKLIDLITLNSDANVITVFYFSDATKQYSTSAEIVLSATQQVQSVVVTKSATALQGLMAVVSDSATGNTTLQWYSQTQTSWGGYSFSSMTLNEMNNVVIMPNTQPIVMDINGDQIMDVLY